MYTHSYFQQLQRTTITTSNSNSSSNSSSSSSNSIHSIVDMGEVLEKIRMSLLQLLKRYFAWTMGGGQKAWGLNLSNPIYSEHSEDRCVETVQENNFWGWLPRFHKMPVVKNRLNKSFMLQWPFTLLWPLILWLQEFKDLPYGNLKFVPPVIDESLFLLCACLSLTLSFNSGNKLRQFTETLVDCHRRLLPCILLNGLKVIQSCSWTSVYLKTSTQRPMNSKNGWWWTGSFLHRQRNVFSPLKFGENLSE